MTNFTKQFKKLYAGKGTANGGLMLALSPQFLKLDEIDEIPIDTDFELTWDCSSKVGLVDIEVYFGAVVVDSYTDIDAQEKTTTIHIAEGSGVAVEANLRIVIKDKLGVLEDEIMVEVVEAGVPDGQFIYMGHSDYHETHVSINSGDSFSSLGKHTTTNSIAVPAHGEYAYFGTYTQLLKVTYDGVWTELKYLAGKAFSQQLMCSDSGQYIIAGTVEGGAYYSTDYGETFQTLRGGSASVNAMFMSRDGKNQVMFIRESSYRRPWFSNDYGTTWTERDTESRVWTACAGTADGSKIYAIGGQGTNSRLYTFTNNGASMTGKQVAARTHTQVQCNADGTLVFVSGFNAQENSVITWLSTNSAANFTQISNLADRRLILSEDGTTLVHVRNRLPVVGSGHVYMRKAPFDTNTSTMIINDSLANNYSWEENSFHISPDGKVITAVNSYSTYGSNIYISVDGGVTFKHHTIIGSILGVNIKRGTQ